MGNEQVHTKPRHVGPLKLRFRRQSKKRSWSAVFHKTQAWAFEDYQADTSHALSRNGQDRTKFPKIGEVLDAIREAARLSRLQSSERSLDSQNSTTRIGTAENCVHVSIFLGKPFESYSKPGNQMVYPEPCNGLRRRIPAAIYGKGIVPNLHLPGF